MLNTAKGELDATNALIRRVTNASRERASAVGERVDRRLAEHGLDVAKINQLQALNVQAALLGSYRANRDQVRASSARPVTYSKHCAPADRYLLSNSDARLTE